MKLRDAEAKVLGVIGIRGDASISELAKLTNLRVHVCRSAVDSLLQRGVISRRIVINPYCFQYAIYGFWFSLNPKAHQVHSKFIKWAVENPSICYVGEFEGSYSFKIDICAANVNQFSRVFESISTKFGDIISKSNLNPVVSISDFGYKAFSPNVEQKLPVEIGYTEELVDIDSIDHQVLQQLGGVRNVTHAQIARTLGVAATTLDYRIKRLFQKKVIVGYQMVAEVESVQALGFVSHVHRLNLASVSRSSISAFKAFALTDPTIYSMTHSIGAYQIEFCTVCDSQAAQRASRNRMVSAFGEIINEHEVCGIIKQHKINSYPFLEKP
jgi:DNA-binding Lrp family transcriptional regulator